MSALDRLHVQRTVREVPRDRFGFVVLFMDALPSKCMTWLHEYIILEKLNEYIILENLNEERIRLDDMYRYVAVLLLSHCTGFSFQKTISLMGGTGSICRVRERVRFIASSILAYSATGRGN